MSSPTNNSVHRLLLACLVTAGSGCSNGTTAPAPVITGIEIDRPSAMLAVGGHVQLTSTARTVGNVAVPNAEVSWSSDAAAVSVSAQGLVTAVMPGVATVTVTSNSRAASSRITVLNGSAGGLVIHPHAPTLALGQQVKLQAIAFDAEGLGSSVEATWTSAATSVAAVDQSGAITGVGDGSAVIRATSAARSAEVAATVVVFAAIAPTGFGGDWAISGPFSVADTSSMAAICGITSAGILYCAGKPYGALAVSVAPALRFKALVSTSDRFCALDREGLPYCWNPAAGGPVPVATALRFRSITAGDGWGATCGLTAESKAYCWGANASKGQLGHGSFAGSSVPVAVATTETFAEIAAHDWATCARNIGGKVFCWGGANLMGSRGVVSNLGVLGIGNDTDSSAAPVAVASEIQFSHLSYGGSRSACAIASDAKLYCWGSMNNQSQFAPEFCQVGSGLRTSCTRKPTEIPTNLRFVLVAPTREGMCGLTTNQQLACWALSEFEVFGLATQSLSRCGPGFPCLPQPTITITDLSFATLSASGGHNVCGIDTAGRALCWGANNVGQLTDSTIGTSTPKPTVFAIDPAR